MTYDTDSFLSASPSGQASCCHTLLLAKLQEAAASPSPATDLATHFVNVATAVVGGGRLSGSCLFNTR